MSDFFSRYPGFQPNPSASARDEFARLARHMNWKVKSKRYKQEWAKFVACEFGHHYGTETTKLQNWQALCHEVQIGAPTDTITQCRKALARVHVNIIDLLDSRRTGAPPTKFPNVLALRRYTLESRKIYPKAAAKADGFLKALLRGIL